MAAAWVSWRDGCCSAHRFFLREGGAGQQADIALAYYLLAALALISLKACCYPESNRLESAAGLMAGLAAWTKNEGILFLAVLLTIRVLMVMRRSGLKAGLRSLAAMGLGMLPVVALLIYFKLQIAPDNDLISNQGTQVTLTRLSEAWRYRQVLAAFVKEMLAIDRWQIYPMLLASYVGLAGLTHRNEYRMASAMIFAVVLTMIGGYFCVYLTTPHDLTWHLRTALHRLLLHLWPASLLMVILAAGKAGTPRPASADIKANAAET